MHNIKFKTNEIKWTSRVKSLHQVREELKQRELLPRPPFSFPQLFFARLLVPMEDVPCIAVAPTETGASPSHLASPSYKYPLNPFHCH